MALWSYECNILQASLDDMGSMESIDSAFRLCDYVEKTAKLAWLVWDRKAGKVRLTREGSRLKQPLAQLKTLMT
jgi:hypothetical protein